MHAPPVRAPNRLSRLPFFYGWVIVTIAMASAILGAAVDHVPMSVLFKPMSEELGWSRSLISGAITVGTVAAALIAPTVGRLADRLGPRLLLSGGAAIVGLCLIALHWASQPWQFYALYVPARALATTLLISVVPFTAVANWFARKRPRVIGLVSMALPLGSAALALIYQLWLPAWGWRGVLLAVGCVMLTFLVLPGGYLLRRRPEDLGLDLDGESPVAAPERGHAAKLEVQWSLYEAIRTATLWLVGSSLTLAALAIGIIGFQMVPYFTDRAIEPVEAASALALFATVGAIASALWGFVAERIPVRLLAIGLLLLSALAAQYLVRVQSSVEVWTFAIWFGITARSQSTLTQILIAQYYGRSSFGAISGAIAPFHLIALGVGPLLASALLDQGQGYAQVFTICIGAYLVAAALLIFARAPEQKAPRHETLPARNA